MTDNTGNTRLHRITAPVVTGAGEHLPGLLGLRSLEHERAILDCGTKKLHLLGRGEAQITLPPGSVSIPLHKAPSGHLVMIIDNYEHMQSARGGIAEASLQLHTDVQDPDAELQSTPSRVHHMRASHGEDRVSQSQGSSTVVKAEEEDELAITPRAPGGETAAQEPLTQSSAARRVTFDI